MERNAEKKINLFPIDDNLLDAIIEGKKALSRKTGTEKSVAEIDRFIEAIKRKS